jgi:hypothetical protein
MSGIATALPGPARGRNVSKHRVTFKDMGKRCVCARRHKTHSATRCGFGWTRRADTSGITGCVLYSGQTRARGIGEVR